MMHRIICSIVTFWMCCSHALAWSVSGTEGGQHVVNHDQEAAVLITEPSQQSEDEFAKGTLAITLICSAPANDLPFGLMRLIFFLPYNEAFSKSAEEAATITLTLSGQGTTNGHVLQHLSSTDEGMLFTFKSVTELEGVLQRNSFAMIGFMLEMLRDSSDEMQFIVQTYDAPYDPMAPATHTPAVAMLGNWSVNGSTSAANHLISACGTNLAPIAPR